MIQFNKITVQKTYDIIKAINLDLSDLVVYTEAATGGYCVTPVIAAMSGAKKVFALAKDSRYGSAQQSIKTTLYFAELANVQNKIQFIFEKNPDDLAQADIITNSGHIRPIDNSVVSILKKTAVIPLMYESWEFRPQDIDLEMCRKKGIPVAGSDERHPIVGILDYLGIMAIKLLLEGGNEIYGSKIAILSDNKFYYYIARMLSAIGSSVFVCCPLELWNSYKITDIEVKYIGELNEFLNNNLIKGLDVLFVVMSTSDTIWIGDNEKSIINVNKLSEIIPGLNIVQFWGEIDREAALNNGLSVVPKKSPKKNHMGILPSDIGLVPIIRLQTGGLKVGEILSHAMLSGLTRIEAEQLAANSGFGQLLLYS